MGKAESASCHATSWLLSMTSFAQLPSFVGWRRESAGWTGAEEGVHQPRPGGAEVEAA